MDETTTPLESGLGWTIAWEPAGREFIGRASLEAKSKDSVAKRFVGLILKDRGVLRSHQRIIKDNREVGEVTSGTFSPVLGKAIAFARIAADVENDCLVEMRGRQLPARIVKPPFVKHGKACY
jgi:aminomethyltransferase